MRHRPPWHVRWYLKRPLWLPWAIESAWSEHVVRWWERHLGGHDCAPV